MMTWLAVWLQQIIAVVLLAGFIDLLLPNKAMQRYVRLVAGLIILLTILTPIIRLLQGDFNARLDQQVESWVKGGAAMQFHMPTIEDIQQQAKDMQRKQQSAAAALTEQKLAESMKDGIAQSTGLQVAAVQVKLGLNQAGQADKIEGVTVTLAPREEHAEESSAAQEAEEAVKEVDAVEVIVQPDEAPGTAGGAAEEKAPEQAPPDAVIQAVRGVLQQGWSVAPKLIDVKVQGEAAGTAN
ncbi:stage III sporulation protein AF [Paenibacillus montanisoli]|uniref:Stage III sporulation protein AF n=1 Tax=Paenibacillus montanisoli TaxID=2081970 RepID=A0A328U130_9BACL|nr:stage III sporulation protein AF [Paenibacillus montanisoli]RAP76488.1 stage III sporulation protein AF [Paenibacillus montanisoli]